MPRHTTLQQFMQKHATSMIDISALPCYLRGRKQDGQFELYPLKILACVRAPFIGMHWIQMHECSDPMWVHSLTRLKRNFYGFTDKLSFERSLYVQYESNLLLLKDIRPFVYVPRENMPLGEILYTTPNQFARISAKRRLIDVPDSATSNSTYIRKRSKLSAERALERVVAAYARDMPHIHLDNVLELLREDMESIFDQLSHRLQDIMNAEAETWHHLFTSSDQEEVVMESPDMSTTCSQESWSLLQNE